ncbi:NAD(P)H-dependent oxidoreductase [Candidatus Azambacteria bacterium]|nr:NAD(P)H-dependent oxidoreductase [Candidatus Azambacteria bacterium]
MKVLALKAIGISGSLRSASKNTVVLKNAIKMASAAGVEVELLNLRDLNVPIYDGDLENEGMPDGVKILREKILEADLLLIASPEYNGSVSGALKNAIDWASRGQNVLDGKIAAIFGASSGSFGTIEGQKHLRDILNKLNCFILPQPRVYISSSGETISDDGTIKDEMAKSKLNELMVKTIEFARKMKQK